jgi:hypothetical protein
MTFHAQELWFSCVMTVGYSSLDVWHLSMAMAMVMTNPSPVVASTLGQAWPWPWPMTTALILSSLSLWLPFEAYRAQRH